MKLKYETSEYPWAGFMPGFVQPGDVIVAKAKDPQADGEAGRDIPFLVCFESHSQTHTLVALTDGEVWGSAESLNHLLNTVIDEDVHEWHHSFVPTITVKVK